ncbi:MAG: hypothetical protein AB8U25_06560 [Rickettsiales endosymbiont of Dermacentor nuttalli]
MITNTNIQRDTLLVPLKTLQNDIVPEIQTLEIYNTSLLSSIEDNNPNPISKELLISEQQSIQEELILLKKHADILHSITISSEKVKEIINTITNHTMPRLTNTLFNEHILPIIQNTILQTNISQEFSSLLFTTIVLNYIKSGIDIKYILA